MNLLTHYANWRKARMLQSKLDDLDRTRTINAMKSLGYEGMVLEAAIVAHNIPPQSLCLMLAHEFSLQEALSIWDHCIDNGIDFDNAWEAASKGQLS